MSKKQKRANKMHTKPTAKRFRPHRFPVFFLVVITLCGGLLPTFGITLDSSKFYRMESRDDGWVAEKSGTELILAADQNEEVMRFKFVPDGNGFYTISTESSADVLTVFSASLASGASVGFAADTGADNQLWQVVDLGDGYCKILVKHSGLALAHTIDTTTTDPVVNDGKGVQLLYDGSDNMKWLIAESHPTPYNNIGVNQNGWAPDQKKIAVFTQVTGSGAPTFSVTGPQTLSGTMASWGSKWGHNFYTADLSSLTTEGQYTLTADGISQDFNIFSGAFDKVRGIHGGELSWEDIVTGFLATQTAPSVSGYDTMPLATGDENVGWTEISGTHTMSNGFYDATSRDSKTARTASAAKFIAMAMLETSDSSKRNALLPVAQMLVDHLVEDQNPDGSFPLGKFRTRDSVSPYHWSIDVGTGIAARNTTALALLAQALQTLDPTRAASAEAAATNGWGYIEANPNSFLIDDPDHAGLLQDYYGNQANVINAAIELYLLTGDTTYSTFADSRINEAEYANGKYVKASGTAWPGTISNKMDGMVDANTVIHLCRYYSSASSTVKNNLDIQISDWNTYWQGLIDTPWGVPENGGAPGVASGWSRNLASLVPQFLQVAKLKDWSNARNAGTAIIDYLLGNNAVASSFYMGAGQNNFHPRFKWSSAKSKGAIIPGIKTDAGALLLTGQASKLGESVTMQSVPVLLALAIADNEYPISTGNHAPMFYADTIETGDAFDGVAYSGSLADKALDTDGDTLSFSKDSGPTWLNVAANGTLSGTPSNLGQNTFTVSVSDGSLSESVTLQIDVKTNIQATSATVNYPVSEDTYAKQGSPTTSYGGVITLELREDGSSTYARVAYLKFNIADLSGRIQSATLKLYATTETNVVNALKVTDTNWGEDTLTWDNRPATGALIDSGQASSQDSWFSIDVTSYVTNNGTYSIALDEQDNSLGKLSSREGDNAPYIEITTAPNNAPAFTSDPVVESDATEDATYSASLTDNASDADGDSMIFAKISGPTWLSVAADGTLSGTPSNADVGLNSWDIEVTDGIDTNQSTLEITVLNVNDAPIFTTDPIRAPDAEADTAYSNSISNSASDVDGDTLTYSKLSGPAWLNIAADGTLSGTPGSDDEGDNTWSILVEDGNGSSDTATLAIKVFRLSDPVTFQVLEDTYAHANKPTNNFGTVKSLEIKNSANKFARVPYLKFNVSGLEGTVMSAKLRVYSETAEDTVKAYEIADNSWTEMGLVWTNRPAFGNEIGTATAQSNTWFEFNISNYVTSNGTYSIALDEQHTTVGDLSSREGIHAAYLEITYQLPPTTPDSLYSDWTDQYPTLGSATNHMDNPDGDELNNLAEYAIGGDPSDPADTGHTPEQKVIDSDGTNWVEYIYARRNDAAERGLEYSLQLSTNLPSNVWTNAPTEEIGSSTLNAEFDIVTNHVSVSGNQNFIRLRIQY